LAERRTIVTTMITTGSMEIIPSRASRWRAVPTTNARITPSATSPHQAKNTATGRGVSIQPSTPTISRAISFPLRTAKDSF
jgi:hypothetical protein